MQRTLKVEDADSGERSWTSAFARDDNWQTELKKCLGIPEGTPACVL